MTRSVGYYLPSVVWTLRGLARDGAEWCGLDCRRCETMSQSLLHYNFTVNNCCYTSHLVNVSSNKTTPGLPTTSRLGLSALIY